MEGLFAVVSLRCVCRAAVVVGVLAITTPVGAQGFVHQFTARVTPSLPGNARNFISLYGCFAIGTGRPVNCSFSHVVIGIKPSTGDPDNNGGHFHTADRPLSLDSKPLEHVGDTDPTPYGVAGFTASGVSGWGRVVHAIPEVSGNLALQSVVVLPPNWICVSGCFTANSRRYEYTYDVGIRDLAELPNLDEEDAVYAKVRFFPDPNHPDPVAFTGSALTLQMLPLVAENYWILSGRRLSVNDMSLIKGGLFDINATWVPPHSSHREGKDADINQGGVGCDQDLELRIAVDQLLSQVETSSSALRSALLCEPCRNGTNCRKHIDFESP
jgi:hypothetical protein